MLPGASWNDARPAGTPLVPPDLSRDFHHPEKSNVLTVVCWEGGLIDHPTGVVFWTAKTQIPFAKTSKTCPQNMTRNSLKNPVKGHLRLASVVALSSSGACGAII